MAQKKQYFKNILALCAAVRPLGDTTCRKSFSWGTGTAIVPPPPPASFLASPVASYSAHRSENLGHTAVTLGKPKDQPGCMWRSGSSTNFWKRATACNIA